MTAARLLCLLLLTLATGCGLFRDREPKLVPLVPTCADYTALAATIVDGRRRGQSRREQLSLVLFGTTAEEIHRGYIDAVYHWPRPTDDAGWTRLRDRTSAAAYENCRNEPLRALAGGL